MLFRYLKIFGISFIIREKNMVLTMIKTIKRIHKEDVVLVKIGEFYHAYGKDACILSYLFGYKLKNMEEVKYTCGFPLRAINKIEAELERNKLGYLLLDRRNNYEVDERVDFKQESNYKSISEKAYTYVRTKERIDNIYNYFLMNINSDDVLEKISKVESIL